MFETVFAIWGLLEALRAAMFEAVVDFGHVGGPAAAMFETVVSFELVRELFF